jgi:hypothetical protein
VSADVTLITRDCVTGVVTAVRLVPRLHITLQQPWLLVKGMHDSIRGAKLANPVYRPPS